MKHCPRCHRPTLEDNNSLNAISHHDEETYICSGCGDQESLIKAGLKIAGGNEIAFVRMLEAQKGEK